MLYSIEMFGCSVYWHLDYIMEKLFCSWSIALRPQKLGLLGMGAQDVHLNFDTAHELWILSVVYWLHKCFKTTFGFVMVRRQETVCVN